jgi:hypothetical protein
MLEQIAADEEQRAVSLEPRADLRVEDVADLVDPGRVLLVAMDEADAPLFQRPDQAFGDVRLLDLAEMAGRRADVEAHRAARQIERADPFGEGARFFRPHRTALRSLKSRGWAPFS